MKKDANGIAKLNIFIIVGVYQGSQYNNNLLFIIVL